MLVDDYAAILKQSIPLIDVRAPAEFVQGAVPSAVNLPLLDDEQRAAIGKSYKKGGREAAVALGYELVQGETRDARTAAWRNFATQHPNAVICCWRGGLRSLVVQQWLAQNGVHLPRVAGGSKALRRFCLETIEASATRRVLLIGGHTGSGKTELLHRFTNHLDLEALANHRGSAFGARQTPQPPPIAFENALATALVQLDADVPLIVEDESRTIGRLAVPTPLFETMQQAPIVLLQVGMAERVENIYREYVENVEGAENPKAKLLTALSRIERRLGGVRYREIRQAMAAAFDAPQAKAPPLHRHWIRCLLRHYYDPMYDYQLSRKEDRVVFRGDRDEAAAYIAEEITACNDKAKPAQRPTPAEVAD